MISSKLTDMNGQFNVCNVNVYVWDLIFLKSRCDFRVSNGNICMQLYRRFTESIQHSI